MNNKTADTKVLTTHVPLSLAEKVDQIAARLALPGMDREASTQ